MRRRIPLNALRAFECAGRHLSFVRAAEELCVTPTAISHQIRQLEELLQTRLFERKGGRLSLTPAAETALASLTYGFDRLDAAFAPLDRRAGRQKITVAASPSFTSLWLLPRLSRFLESTPDVDVTITSVISFEDSDVGTCDLSICNSGSFPGRTMHRLMDERIFPVCAPSLLPSDGECWTHTLGRLPLIHDDKPADRAANWERFCDDMQISRVDATKGMRFNQSSLAIEAAIKGYGVILGRSRLIADALADGRLVPLLKDHYHQVAHYYTVLKYGPVRKPLQAFVNWLAAEARAQSQESAWIEPEDLTAVEPGYRHISLPALARERASIAV